MSPRGRCGEDYGALLAELEGPTGRQAPPSAALAQTAYARTGPMTRRQHLDGRGHRARPPRAAAPSPARWRRTLRYGENPHQRAAFYTDGSPAPAWRRHAAPGQGAELQQHQRHRRRLRAGRSSPPATARPCASSSTPTPAAWRAARRCGGLQQGLRLRPHIGLRRHRGAERPLDGETAEEIAEIFTEVVIAPEAPMTPRDFSPPRRTCAC